MTPMFSMFSKRWEVRKMAEKNAEQTRFYQEGGKIRMSVENKEILFEWDESLTYFTVDYEQALTLYKNLGEAIKVLKDQKGLKN